MFLESLVVPRKTPSDGKLEISRATADAIRRVAPRVTVHANGADAEGTVMFVECTCEKGSESGAHEHCFLQSDLFKSLRAGSELSLELSPEERTVVLARGRKELWGDLMSE